MTGEIGFVLLLMSLRRRAMQIRLAAFLASAILGIGLLPACGDGYSAGSNRGESGGSNGTTPGGYTVKVNAYNISSSDTATPSATTTFHLTVN